MARKKTDNMAAARARLIRLEQQAAARAEARKVAEGVAETVALSRERGAEIASPQSKRADRAQPHRRLSGLTWLLGKSRITQDQWAAGERYRKAYQRAKGTSAIRSILDREPGGGAEITIAAMLANAESAVYAAEKLRMYRGQLYNHAKLIAACDAICGEEKTPREAAANGRGADATEALLIVALDMLIQHLAPPREKAAPDVACAA